jgi:hypothetical protein
VTPAWVLGSDIDILMPVGEGPRGDDVAAMATVTRAEYLQALEQAVEVSDLRADYLEPEWQERSWARFVAFREGEHAVGCECCDACRAKRPAPAPPPLSPTVPAAEDRLYESGPRQRRSLATEHETESPYQAEQRRLRQIAAEAPIRYF